MTANNLQLFAGLDDAFNQRDWDTYAAGFADDFKGWNTRTGDFKDKAAHIAHAQEFSRLFVDSVVHNAPYVFGISNGDWTCTVARFTGTMTGIFGAGTDGEVAATQKSFDILLANFARWQDGKVVEEFEFLDQAEIFHQAGITNN